MEEMRRKSKIKRYIPSILIVIGIIGSLSYNGYLYNKYSLMSKDSMNKQQELKDIQKKYEQLSVKVEDIKKNPSTK